jgi:hypothetical protein
LSNSFSPRGNTQIISTIAIQHISRTQARRANSQITSASLGFGCCSSWLNQVELCFRLNTQQTVGRGSFMDTKALTSESNISTIFGRLCLTESSSIFP